VQEDNRLAKFWLQPVNLASSIGFNAKELNQLLGLVREHEALFLELGMTSLTLNAEPIAQSVETSDSDLVVRLTDGRVLSAPLAWSLV